MQTHTPTQHAPQRTRAVIVAASAALFLAALAPGAHADADSYLDQLNASVTTDRLRDTHARISSEPHVAGTPGSMRTVQWIADQFRAMGLDVETPEYFVHLPRFVDASLEIVAPACVTLSIMEAPISDDPHTSHPDLQPGWNAFGACGDVTAPVVYANYGTVEDFNRLRELGVDVRDKIVLARYGRNYRGFKAKFAEEAGAAGLIIYTDPADSGYVRGLVYPEGGYANATQIQRGSVKATPYPGDPLTPFVAATKEAPRLDPVSVGLPRIPVQPIGYGAASEIMGRMRGEPTPREWQGGLPFTYRLTGGDDLRVRMRIEQPREQTRIVNVVGALRGAVFPDQLVVVGSHHDAWNFGATDPNSGTMVTIECARAFAEMARRGVRPARTILFCAWDAEEFGIIGSTEWVEQHADTLGANAVAYINLDMSVTGDVFGATASSPSVLNVIESAAYGCGADTLDVRIGLTGGGSDHVGFAGHLAIPSINLGMRGGPGVSYHSNYDTIAWWRKVVGEDYTSAQRLAHIVNGVLVAVAGDAHAGPNGDPCGYMSVEDVARIPRELLVNLAILSAVAERAGFMADLRSLEIKAAELSMAADRLREAHDERRSGRGGSSTDDAEFARAWSELFIRLDRAWRDDDGLPDRPWYRNLYVAPDENSGYAAWAFPALRRAVERNDASEFAAASKRVTRAMDVINDTITAMESLLRER